MRAAVVHGPGDLRIEEIPEPEPAAGEIVVEIEAALTCGTDAKTLRNGHPAAPPYPFVLGHEMAGTIVAVGTEWTRFPVGTRVVVANSAPCMHCSACRRGEPFLCRARTFLTGAFAERIRVPEPIARLNVHRVPETLESALAALTEHVRLRQKL